MGGGQSSRERMVGADPRRPVPSRGHGRCCRQCGDPIQWGVVRLVGSRPFCSEACAVIALADEASRTAWVRATLELQRKSRDLRFCMRLALARWRAWRAQRRLDRRLDAGPQTQSLPWIWVPPRPAAVGLILVVVALTATGGPPPETRAMVPAPARLPVAPPRVTAPVAPPQPPPSSATQEAARPVPRETPAVPALSVPPPPTVHPVAPPAPRPRPVPRIVADDFTRGSLAIPEVAFTFDGGDEPNVTDAILDVLRARGIRATMFLTGQFIRRYPEVVRRMLADGHEIGNHTDSHPHLTTYAQNHRQQTLASVTQEFLVGQFRRAEDSFRSLTGQPMAPYWRAPFGEHNAEIRAWAVEAGYRLISWTHGAGMAEDLDTRDWVADRSSRIYRTSNEIATRILEFGRGRPEGLNGGIVLMHLASHRRTDRPHESLPYILKTLQGRGYRLVTISELLADAEPRQAAMSPAVTREPPAGTPTSAR